MDTSYEYIFIKNKEICPVLRLSYKYQVDVLNVPRLFLGRFFHFSYLLSFPSLFDANARTKLVHVQFMSESNIPFKSEGKVVVFSAKLCSKKGRPNRVGDPLS